MPFAGIALALPVQRLVLGDLLGQDLASWLCAPSDCHGCRFSFSISSRSCAISACEVRVHRLRAGGECLRLPAGHTFREDHRVRTGKIIGS